MIRNEDAADNPSSLYTLDAQVPDLSKWIASLGSGLAGADPSLVGAEQVIICLSFHKRCHPPHQSLSSIAGAQFNTMR